MRAFRSSNNLRARQPKECNPDQSTRPSGAYTAPSTSASASALASSNATHADQQPNLFTRLLRRAQSKRTLKPEERRAAPPLPAAKESRHDVAVHGEDGDQRTTTAERKPTLRLRKSIRDRFRGPEQQSKQPDAPETTNKPAVVYVPKHAAVDFTRTAVPKPDAVTGFPSLDEPRRQPSSSSHAPVVPNLDCPRTNSVHHEGLDDNDLKYLQQQLQLLQPQTSNDVKRRSWAMSNTDSRTNRFSFASYNAEADYVAAAPANAAVVGCDETPLQPTSNADLSGQQRPRQSKRHSYRLVPDPHDAVIEEETDFQRFLSKAAEEDRQYRQNVWRTLPPLPAVDHNVPDLDLQALLGGVDWNTTTKPQQSGRERSNSYNKRASNSHRKRASMISYRSQTDRTGKQQQQQPPNSDNMLAPPSTDLKVKRKPSVTKRVQEYFKPEALTNHRD
ncbi:uncharacterized protein PG998_003745 [Apiospora kogelbergensis]|uniref:uncharacterized protein n=1 Tax=Apiospora kogelbergensis TaxID=1337665 RepID=UPI00312E44F5